MSEPAIDKPQPGDFVVLRHGTRAHDGTITSDKLVCCHSCGYAPGRGALEVVQLEKSDMPPENRNKHTFIRFPCCNKKAGFFTERFKKCRTLTLSNIGKLLG